METQVMKYQIIKPTGCDWKEFGKVLNEIQYETRQILNKSIQLAWEYYNFSQDYKKQAGNYPKAKEVIGYSNIHGYAYNLLKNEYYRLNTSNLSTTIKRGTDRFKNDLKDILRGDMAVPSYRKNQPIDIHNKNIKLEKNIDNEYIATLSLISKSYKQEIERKAGQFSVVIKARDKTQKSILDRVIEGQYKISTSQLLKDKKGKWYLNLSYQFERQERELDKKKVMGIDMGIVYPVYMAFNFSPARYKIGGGEIDQFRKGIDKRRRQMLEQGKYCGDGRVGHGRQKRIEPIDKLTNKVENFRQTTNHKYSKFVVDKALKYGCGVIQMEDLTAISAGEKPRFLKNWTYYDLQQKIQYKAEREGIEVRYIQPDYTSQRCSECGYTDRENRKDQETFACLECGVTMNADYNAAKNISMMGSEKLVKT